MKYQVQLELPVSARKAYEHFTDRHAMLKWEPGLSMIEDLNGTLFHEHSEGFLVFGGLPQPMKMKVTVERLDPPQGSTMIYEVPGAWNRCVNRFDDHSDGCIWTMDVEFRFDDEPPVGKEQFEKATLKSMQVFRDYLMKLN